MDNTSVIRWTCRNPASGMVAPVLPWKGFLVKHHPRDGMAYMAFHNYLDDNGRPTKDTVSILNIYPDDLFMTEDGAKDQYVEESKKYIRYLIDKAKEQAKSIGYPLSYFLPGLGDTGYME